jgi:hypothetical protein
MKERSKLHSTLLLVALAGSALAAADEGQAFEVKIRAGLKGGDLQQKHVDNKVIGFALGGRRPLGQGWLTGEVGFDLLPGQAHDATPFSGPVYAPAGSALGTADPVSHNPYFLRANESLDLRKESSQGFSVKLGYAAPLALGPGLTWQAGLSVDAYKTSSEFTGTLRPMVMVGASPTQVADSLARKYYEGFATVAQGVALTPGFYAGLRQRIGEDFALELNLRNVGTKHFDYRATTYTGRPASTDSSTIRGFIVDFSLSLKL